MLLILQRRADQIDSNSTPFEYDVLTDTLPTTERRELILSLKETQSPLIC